MWWVFKDIILKWTVWLIFSSCNYLSFFSWTDRDMARRKIGDVHDQALVAVAHAQDRDQGQGGPGEEEIGQGFFLF